MQFLMGIFDRDNPNVIKKYVLVNADDRDAAYSFMLDQVDLDTENVDLKGGVDNPRVQDLIQGLIADETIKSFDELETFDTEIIDDTPPVEDPVDTPVETPPEEDPPEEEDPPAGEGNLPLEWEDSRAAFLRGAGIGSGFGTIADRFMKNQFRPFRTAFDFSELIGGFGGEGENERTAEETARAFEDFTSAHSLPDVQRKAAESLAALFGDPTEDPDDVDLAAMFSQPTDQQATDFGDLAMTALGSKISPFALRLLGLPSSGELRSEFLAAGGGDGGDFREFVKRRFGLEKAGVLGQPQPNKLPPRVRPIPSPGPMPLNPGDFVRTGVRQGNAGLR